MKKVTLALGALAAITLAGCSPQQERTLQDGSIATAETSPASATTARSGVEQIASLALSMMDPRNEPVELADTLVALEAGVARSGGELPPATRAAIAADLQSANDAAQLGDWQAVREAASSIYARLK